MVWICDVRPSSSANEVGNASIPARTHSTNNDHVLRSPEAAIPAAMIDYTLRKDRADARQLSQIGNCRLIDIEPFG